MPPRSKPAAVTSGDVEQRLVELSHPMLESVLVRVRRGRRTRHVRLHVCEQGEVTASIPARFSAARLDPIVRERADWLHDVLTRMAQKSRDTEVDLERGDPVRWLGRWIPTSLERGGRRASVRLSDDGERLLLRVPDDEDPCDALVAWYRREARGIFERSVAEWAGLFGLVPGRVSVREQRTRWGSCTHKGDLSFNWRLVLAPEWVLESIVVHELCHIDELNHSSRFWALLDERFPEHQAASDWLRDHGTALRVSRPSSQRSTPTVPMSDGRVAPARLRRGQDRLVEDGQISLFGP